MKRDFLCPGTKPLVAGRVHSESDIANRLVAPQGG